MVAARGTDMAWCTMRTSYARDMSATRSMILRSGTGVGVARRRRRYLMIRGIIEAIGEEKIETGDSIEAVEVAVGTTITGLEDNY